MSALRNTKTIPGAIEGI